IDLTAVVFNNSIYGMTSGQYSPLTPRGKFATTAPYGTIEREFDLCDLAIAAGASYVGRGTTFHAQLLTDLIVKGIANKGFSLIEGISQCPTYYGRKNKMGGPIDMMKWQQEHSVNAVAATKM
ncbi:MAG TPA: 2-oxoglutarate ferredoxin oxidoreductase subunit beta, partial [Firmicutes bacterium]|nr:2-oxoglutarate ferredoxin oxidoreductase subunit beta [Bacillota bacterium]